jgi:hypothetical protein
LRRDPFAVNFRSMLTLEDPRDESIRATFVTMHPPSSCAPCTKPACVQHVCPVITIPAVAYTFLLFAEQAPDLPKALPHRAVSYSPHQQ